MMPPMTVPGQVRVRARARVGVGVGVEVGVGVGVGVPTLTVPVCTPMRTPTSISFSAAVLRTTSAMARPSLTWSK
jgi:hypothetical protein